jgi:hypothetical protein
MKMYSGMEVYFHEFLTTALDRVEWGNFMPWLCYILAHSPRHSMDRRLVGPQNWSGNSDEETERERETQI